MFEFCKICYLNAKIMLGFDNDHVIKVIIYSYHLGSKSLTLNDSRCAKCAIGTMGNSTKYLIAQTGNLKKVS